MCYDTRGRITTMHLPSSDTKEMNAFETNMQKSSQWTTLMKWVEMLNRKSTKIFLSKSLLSRILKSKLLSDKCWCAIQKKKKKKPGMRY